LVSIIGDISNRTLKGESGSSRTSGSSTSRTRISLSSRSSSGLLASEAGVGSKARKAGRLIGVS
jgi:hypothetical protein